MPASHGIGRGEFTEMMTRSEARAFLLGCTAADMGCDPEFDNPYPRTGNPDKERRARSCVSVRILTGQDAGGGVRIGARRIDV